VGRLDEESKGLLLLTSDGEFAERIAHPRYGVPKTYLVKVPGKVTDEAVQKIRDGVHLAEGRTAGARILIKRRTATSSTLEVSIQEGKNREVRRVFARVGYKVLSLTRTRIGPLGIRGLREGKWRALSRDEVEALLARSGTDRETFDDADDARIDERFDEPSVPRPPARRRGAPRAARGGPRRGARSRGRRRGSRSAR
jgi:23S rRNA pseudouridine2605 synthase